MAQDRDDSTKTEDPTQKRMDDAHEKGQIATSREINHLMMIAAGGLCVYLFAPDALRAMYAIGSHFIATPHAIDIDGSGAALLGSIAFALAGVLTPIFVVLIVVAIASGMVQSGPMIAGELIKPKFEKISPLKGLKRQFSLRALVEFAKGLIKIAVIAAIAWYVLYPDMLSIERFADQDVSQLLGVFERYTLLLAMIVVAVMVVVAALDYLYQRLSHWQGLRMSREELREEFKQTEGDPMIRGRLKQIRLERARRRMMQDVPKATVVIANPVHFAVALLYEQPAMAAPRVVAKGADLVAHRIRAVAAEHGVPVIENPPLARALFASTEIDREIPPEHYRAVAEVIGYVMKLRHGRKPAARPATRP